MLKLWATLASLWLPRPPVSSVPPLLPERRPVPRASRERARALAPTTFKPLERRGRGRR